jgi:hypothetical protein
MIDHSDTFVDCEYVEQVRESLSLSIVSLGQQRAYLRNVKHEHEEPFKHKCVQLLDRLINRIDEMMRSLDVLEYPRNVQDAMAYQRFLFDIEDICGNLHLAIDQRSEGHISEQSNYGGRIKSSFAADKVYIAIDNLMTHFIKSFLPREIAEEIVVVIAFGSGIGYQVSLVPIYLPLIAVVHIPQPDLYRCRYWTSLCHEAAHLYYEYASIPRQISIRLQDMTSQLNNIGITVWGIDSTETSKRQLQEIICDFASMTLCGLPDLLTFVTSYYDQRIDATGFKYHPPFGARVDYMFKYLETLKGSEAFDDILKKCKASWTKTKRKSVPSRTRLYNTRYKSFVTDNYDELLSISRRFIAVPQADYFSAQTWENASKAYEEYKRGKPLVDLPLDAIGAFSLMWVKRFDICKRLGGSSAFSSRLATWHKNDGKIFNEIVDFLLQKM